LVPLDGRVVRYMMPSKLYGILASGTPLIAVAPEDCELSRLVQAKRVGFVAPVDDAAALAYQIAYCADHPAELTEMGRVARAIAIQKFDRCTVTAHFAGLVNDVLGLEAMPQSAPLETVTSHAPQALQPYSAAIGSAEAAAVEQS